MDMLIGLISIVLGTIIGHIISYLLQEEEEK